MRTVRDTDGGGCDCMRIHCVWTQMVVDAGEGKERRKKERNLLGVDGGHNCVQTCCVCMGCERNEGWWWTWADEGKEIR